MQAHASHRPARVRPAVMDYHYNNSNSIRLIGHRSRPRSSGAAGHRRSRNSAPRSRGALATARIHHRRPDHGVGLGCVPGDDDARPVRIHLGAVGLAAAGDHRARHRRNRALSRTIRCIRRWAPSKSPRTSPDYPPFAPRPQPAPPSPGKHRSSRRAIGRHAVFIDARRHLSEWSASTPICGGHSSSTSW